MRLPAEWEQQSAILLSLPHIATDWADYLDSAISFYMELIRSIVDYQKVVLITPDQAHTKELLKKHNLLTDQLIIFEADTNDTWIRDYGFITVLDDTDQPILLDFEFNGWGLKFASNHDNQINSKLFETLFADNLHKKAGFVLEGGSIESDGKGTILTTTTCLLSDNRHPHKDKAELEELIKKHLGAKRVLWIENGHLENDDTDAHIDTLVRFVDEKIICYVGCNDESDSHFEGLKKMEKELEKLVDFEGDPYHLIKLPMVDAIYYDDERLPATYANFLIINSAVIVPIYGVPSDDQAMEIFAKIFPDRKVIPLDASVLVRQHGSIHCITMQVPKQVKINH